MSLSSAPGAAEKHVVNTYVYVVDGDGERLQGVTVSLDVESPEGTTVQREPTTDSRGRARMQVTQDGGGHGAWESCVTGLSQDYDPAANAETCDRVTVS